MLWFDILKNFNIIMSVLFLVLYFYEIVYLVVGTVMKPRKFKTAQNLRRFAFCIAARNEENVISQLIDSIKEQKYPCELIDIYVVADNCNDNTAAVAQDRGVYVFRRQNASRIGKGYALTFLFDKIRDRVGFDFYDGYFIVDADNILDKNYVFEMNNCIDAGNRLIMCYRNSKNYTDNWLSAGYSLWFLRASRQLNMPRQYFGVSCEITGTGFYVCSDIIKKNGGWIHYCLIEDIEFTVESVLSGETVAFCYDAIVYDEQPVGFLQSVRQRKRWCRGYFQIIRKYGARLLLNFLRGRGFSNYDLIMGICIAFFVSLISTAVNLCFGVIIAMTDFSLIPRLLRMMGMLLLSAYMLLFFLGVMAGACEWERIRGDKRRVILYFFTFPIFIFSFLPIAVISMFSKNKWEPVFHRPTDPSKFDRE